MVILAAGWCFRSILLNVGGLTRLVVQKDRWGQNGGPQGYHIIYLSLWAAWCLGGRRVPSIRKGEKVRSVFLASGWMDAHMRSGKI